MIIGDIHHPECAGLSPVLLEAVRLAVKASRSSVNRGVMICRAMIFI